MLDTPRLRQHVWASGPDDGRPLLLVHGNITTGGFWRYVAERLPADVRVIAPDLRSFGLTEPKPVDATRGLRDMADDVHDLRGTPSPGRGVSSARAGRWVEACCSSTSSTTLATSPA